MSAERWRADCAGMIVIAADIDGEQSAWHGELGEYLAGHADLVLALPQPVPPMALAIAVAGHVVNLNHGNDSVALWAHPYVRN